MAILRYCQPGLLFWWKVSTYTFSMAISWSCANITKKVDPLVATTGKNRICLSEFRGPVLKFHQNPDEPIDLRIPAIKSNFKMIRYLKNEPKRSSQNFSKKEAESKNLKKSKIFNGSKRPIFRAIYYHDNKILRQTIFFITNFTLVARGDATVNQRARRPTHGECD